MEHFDHGNPENWRAGLFYYNRNDSRFIVPKRNPALGWTINFAHKKAWIGFLLIIVLILAQSLFFGR